MKMQASAKTATVIDPSTSRLTGNFHMKDGTACAHVFVTSRDCLGKESREEVQGSKSSWFQRLKSRDDMVTTEASRIEKERVSRERVQVSVRSVEPDCLSQNTGSRSQQSLQAKASSDVKRQKTIDGKDKNDGRSATVQEKLSSREAARRSTTSAPFMPAETGFGPYINMGFGRRSETEKVGSTTPQNMIDATAHGPEHCKESKGNQNSGVNISPKSLPVSMQGEALAAVICKPLSPKQCKLGLPPRPPCHKVLGFSPTGRASIPACGPGRGAFHQLTIPSGQSSAAPGLEMQDREVGKHAESSLSRAAGSVPQNSKVIDRSMSDAVWHNKVSIDGPLSPTRTGNGDISCVKLEQRRGSCSDVGTGRVLENDLPEPACENVSSSTPGTGLQLKFVESGAETMKNSSSLNDASLDFSKSKLCQLAGGSQHEKQNVIEQAANASTSTSSPWELFIEPAGASKIARENFVEVYNRARDELKNQRLSQSMSRPLNKELDGGPKLTLGPSSAISLARIEVQSLKHEQEMSGPVPFQGNITRLEEQSMFYHSNLKKQDALTVSGGSQCRQAEGFQRTRWVSENPPISSSKGFLLEGHMDVSIQRRPEGSTVYGRELKTSEHDVAPSNPFCENGLVSILDKDMKCTGVAPCAGESCKQSNGQEAVSVLGKRARATFEDHGITLAAEKIAASRPRTHSKPHLWLQRWNSVPKYSSNGLPAKTQIPADDAKSDSHYLNVPAIKKFRDEDLLGASGHASSDRVKWLKTNSSKVLPSAAAMAIVGTAARQFCASQPEGKGSFAFWSGFGTQAYRRVQPTQEKGKEQLCEKPNEDLHGC